MTRCDCCDLPVESCGKAAEERERQVEKARRETLVALGWRTAEYTGSCVGCRSPIITGVTLIRRSVGGGWFGDCCAPAVPDPSLSVQGS